MTETIKQCRVCGDPINAHRVPLRDCIKKAYELPSDWPGDYQSYLLLCLKKGYLQSYGGSSGMGVTTLFFKHMEDKVVTAKPADDIARILLVDLAPQAKKLRDFVPGSTWLPADPSLLEEEGKDKEEEVEHTIVDEDGEQVG